MLKRLAILFVFISCFYGFGQEYIVADLKVQGNKKIKASFVRQISEIRTGKVLDSTQMETDIARLKRTPSVAHAYYQVFYSHDNQYNVIYNIEENFTIIPQLSVYTANTGEFAFRTGLYEYNALGRNITVGGFFQKDVFNSFGINFRSPYLIGNKIGLAVNFQDLTTQEPVFLPNGTADYRYNNTSLEVAGLYEFNFNHRIEAGLTLFNEDYSYLFGETDPSVPQDFNVDKYLIKGVYQFTNIDYYYQYLDGFSSTFVLQYVFSSEDTLPDFIIGWNDFLYFLRVGEKGNWASRLRLGLATNSDSPFAPFSVDNNLNIRGVGNTIDRGTGAIILNTEYRHTLYEKDWFVFQGNVFVDAGSWRNPGGDFGDFGDNQNIRVYPGLGVRFIHKRIFNTIFRIDYGHGLTKEATRGFVFGIGQYF